MPVILTLEIMKEVWHPQEPVSTLVLFNSFVTKTDSGIESIPSNSLSCMELCTSWREGMPSRDTLTGMERGVHENIMNFNRAKLKVLHVGESNPKHKHRLGERWIKS